MMLDRRERQRKTLSEKTGNDLFQDLLQHSQHTIPTLRSVASKISQQEGKTLDVKQHIAYEIISCLFMLSLIEEAEFNCTSALHAMEVAQREVLVQHLKA